MQHPAPPSAQTEGIANVIVTRPSSLPQEVLDAPLYRFGSSERGPTPQHSSRIVSIPNLLLQYGTMPPPPPQAERPAPQRMNQDSDSEQEEDETSKTKGVITRCKLNEITDP